MTQGRLTPLRHGGMPGGFMHRSEPSLHHPRSQSSGAASKPATAPPARNDLGPLPPPMGQNMFQAERRGGRYDAERRAGGGLQGVRGLKERSAVPDGFRVNTASTTDSLRLNTASTGRPGTNASPFMGYSGGLAAADKASSPLRTDAAATMSSTAGMSFHTGKGSLASTSKGPDPGPRSPFVVVMPHSWSRSTSPPADAGQARSLDSYRPAFRTDWLMALRRELLEGIQTECFILRRDFAAAVTQIQNEVKQGVADTSKEVEQIVERIVGQGIRDIRSDLSEALQLDAQNIKPITSYGRRTVDIDYKPILNEIRDKASAVKGEVQKHNLASTKSVRELIESEMSKAHNERNNALHELQRAQTSLTALHEWNYVQIQESFKNVEKRIDSQSEQSKAHLDPILDKVANIKVEPVVDLQPIMDAFEKIPSLEPVLESLARIEASELDLDLGPVSEIVDLVKEQGAVINGVSSKVDETESAVKGLQLGPISEQLEASKTVLSSIDGLLASLSAQMDGMTKSVEAQSEAMIGAASSGFDGVGEQLASLTNYVNASGEIVNEIRTRNLWDQLGAIIKCQEATKKAADSTLDRVTRIDTQTATELPKQIVTAVEGIPAKVQAATALGAVTATLKELQEDFHKLAHTATNPKVNLNPVLEAIDKLDYKEHIIKIDVEQQTMKGLLKDTAKDLEFEVGAVADQLKNMDFSGITNALADIDTRHMGKLTDMETKVTEVADKMSAEFERTTAQIDGIQVNPQVNLDEVIEAVHQINSGPLMEELMKTNEKVEGNLSQVNESLAQASTSNEKASHKLDRGFGQIHWNLQKLKALECTLLSYLHTSEQVGVRNEQALGSIRAAVERIDARPDVDLTPLLVAVADVDAAQRTTQEKINSNHDETSKRIDDMSASLHSEVGAVHATAREINVDTGKTVEALANTEAKQAEMKEVIDSIDSKPPADISPVITGLRNAETQHMQHHLALLEQFKATHEDHLVPLAQVVANIDAKPATDLTPVLSDLTRLHGTCGATLQHVRGNQDVVKSLLWTTPAALM